MLNETLLIGYIAASLVVLVSPGPGVAYVVARSAIQGRHAGVVSAAGLSAGALVHVVAAVAGLSAVLAASATAFEVVKLIGAAYLIYLGVKTLLSGSAAEGSGTVEPTSLRRLFWDGVVVSIFNPKIAIFFLAFLPQFVDPVLGHVSVQILLLGILYAALSFLTDSAYACVAGGMRRWLVGVSGGRWLRRVTGGTFIGLGVYAAFAGRPTQ